MNVSRVTSELWIAALRRRLDLEAVPIVIRQKGDKLAGAIAISVTNLCGSSRLFVEAHSLDGERHWIELASGLDEQIEKALQRQKKFDNDLWILEVEERGRIDFYKEFLLST